MRIYSFFGADGVHESFNETIAHFLRTDIKNLKGPLAFRVIAATFIVLFPCKDRILFLDSDTRVMPVLLQLNFLNQISLVVHREHSRFIKASGRATLISLTGLFQDDFLFLPHPIKVINAPIRQSECLKIFIHKSHLKDIPHSVLIDVKTRAIVSTNCKVLAKNYEFEYLDTSIYSVYLSVVGKVDAVLCGTRFFINGRASGIICDCIALGTVIVCINGWDSNFHKDYGDLINAGWIVDKVNDREPMEVIRLKYINSKNNEWIKYFGNDNS